MTPTDRHAPERHTELTPETIDIVEDICCYARPEFDEDIRTVCAAARASVSREWLECPDCHVQLRRIPTELPDGTHSPLHAEALDKVWEREYRSETDVANASTDELVKRLKEHSAILYDLARTDFAENNPLTGEAFDADGRRIVEAVLALDAAAEAIQTLQAQLDLQLKFREMDGKELDTLRTQLDEARGQLDAARREKTAVGLEGEKLLAIAHSQLSAALKDKETLREALQQIYDGCKPDAVVGTDIAYMIARTALASLTPSGEKEGE